MTIEIRSDRRSHCGNNKEDEGEKGRSKDPSIRGTLTYLIFTVIRFTSTSPAVEHALPNGRPYYAPFFLSFLQYCRCQ